MKITSTHSFNRPTTDTLTFAPILIRIYFPARAFKTAFCCYFVPKFLFICIQLLKQATKQTKNLENVIFLVTIPGDYVRITRLYIFGTLGIKSYFTAVLIGHIMSLACFPVYLTVCLSIPFWFFFI